MARRTRQTMVTWRRSARCISVVAVMTAAALTPATAAHAANGVDSSLVNFAQINIVQDGNTLIALPTITSPPPPDPEERPSCSLRMTQYTSAVYVQQPGFDPRGFLESSQVQYDATSSCTTNVDALRATVALYYNGGLVQDPETQTCDLESACAQVTATDVYGCTSAFLCAGFYQAHAQGAFHHNTKIFVSNSSDCYVGGGGHTLVCNIVTNGANVSRTYPPGITPGG